jgi:hypothetical protein
MASLMAGLNIESSDIQFDANGYFYIYELTWSDMLETSMNFENDVESSYDVEVNGPSLKTARFIHASA